MKTQEKTGHGNTENSLEYLAIVQREHDEFLKRKLGLKEDASRDELTKALELLSKEEIEQLIQELTENCSPMFRSMKDLLTHATQRFSSTLGQLPETATSEFPPLSTSEIKKLLKKI